MRSSGIGRVGLKRGGEDSVPILPAAVCECWLSRASIFTVRVSGLVSGEGGVARPNTFLLVVYLGRVVVSTGSLVYPRPPIPAPQR